MATKQHTDISPLHTLLTLILALSPALPASAQPPSEARLDLNARVEELSQEGARLFNAGKPAEAIALFEEAYALVPVANLLYNIALVYERSGEPAKAIVYYERFIAAPDADTDARSRARARIADLKRASVTAPGSQPGPAPAPRRRQQEELPELSDLALTGVLVGGIGVAMVGTGAVFAVRANSDEDASRATQDAEEKDALRDSAESKTRTSNMLFVAGGLAVAAGTTLILLGLNEDDTQTKTSGWEVTPGPGDVGVGLTVSWSEP